MNLKFQKITDASRKDAEALTLFPDQKGFIESVAECLQEADEEERWQPYGIYDDKTLIGFTMYGCLSEASWGTRVWMDRLLIDRRFQGKGYGKAAVDALKERLFHEYDTDKIYLSVYDYNPHAVSLYKKAGFEYTGELDTKGEKVMCVQR